MSTRKLLRDLDAAIVGKKIGLNRGGNFVRADGTWRDDDNVERYQQRWLYELLEANRREYDERLWTTFYLACRTRPSHTDREAIRRSRWLRKVIRRRYRLAVIDKVEVCV